jgi:threonine dehydrogenase-like Zn-dependent dehydrogenase
LIASGFGAGPIGLVFISLVKAAGAGTIAVFEMTLQPL